MRITRKQSTILAFSTIGLFIVIGSLISKGAQSPDARSKLVDEISAHSIPASTEVDSTAESTLPNPADLTLNHFHRSETKDGRKLWEVDAEVGQYYPQDHAAELRQAVLLFFKESGDEFRIETKKARIGLLGGALTNAQASEGVTIYLNENVKIVTDAAEFDHQQSTVHAAGLVTITSNATTVTGVGLTGAFAKQEFHLLSNVTTVIPPRSATHANN